MSDVRKPRSLAALISGRWQVPLLVCAIAASVVAYQRLRPEPPQPIDFKAVMTDLARLRESGAYRDASDAAANLLTAVPPLGRAEKAQLHEYISDVVYRQEKVREKAIAANARLIVDHYGLACQSGRAATATGLLRVAEAHEWLGESGEAIESLRQTLEASPQADERRVAMQALARLYEGRPALQPERRALLEQLLSDEGVSPAYVWWALRQSIEEAAAAGEGQRGEQLLERAARLLKRSDLRGYYDYLQAALLIEQGRALEAQPLVQGVEEWLGQRASADSELDSAGFLPALNGVLAGRIELLDQRPQAALDRFERAMALDPLGDAFVQGAAGAAQALAELQRHAAAQALLRAAAERLTGSTTGRVAALPRLAAQAQALFAACSAAAEHAAAIGYGEAALALMPNSGGEARLQLTEDLAHTAAAAAASATGSEVARLRLCAAQHYDEAAQLAADDPVRRGNLLWRAAQMYGEVGEHGAARRELAAFLEARQDDPRRPAALVQLAQTHEAEGDFAEAAAAYQRVIAGYAGLEEAARARLLRAQCLLAMDEASQAEAERLLLGLLEDDQIAPDARVYRDALYALGELLYEQDRFSAAIRRFEDFQVLYPDDPQRQRVQFLTADAYRRSAYELRDRPPRDASSSAAALESRRRFQTAGELFGRFLTETQATGDAGESAGLYPKLALLYRADCLYELNDADSRREALAAYRQAAARYQREPAALTAQVQIANIQLREGQHSEAARAIENARWLLRSIPDEAFRGAGGPDRAGWERFLTTVSEAPLLNQVLADAR